MSESITAEALLAEKVFRLDLVVAKQAEEIEALRARVRAYEEREAAGRGIVHEGGSAGATWRPDPKSFREGARYAQGVIVGRLYAADEIAAAEIARDTHL